MSVIVVYLVSVCLYPLLVVLSVVIVIMPFSHTVWRSHHLLGIRYQLLYLGLGLSPTYPPKGWGSVATPPPKPHWGGADSHVTRPGVCPGLMRKCSSAHA